MHVSGIWNCNHSADLVCAHMHRRGRSSHLAAVSQAPLREQETLGSHEGIALFGPFFIVCIAALSHTEAKTSKREETASFGIR